MRVLVTGASGFIGAHVARALAAAGASVRTLSRTDPPPEASCDEHVNADLRDADALRRAASDCAAVVHVAAVYSYARSRAGEMALVNVEGTRAVLDAAARGPRRRVVVTSSAATCGPVPGRPADERDVPSAFELAVPYKRTKIEAERLALCAAAEGLDVVAVNPTTTVGRGDRRPTPSGQMILDVIHGRIRAYIAGAALNVVAVEDVAAGHALALERGRRGERYVLGGDNLPLRDVFRLVAEHAQIRVPSVAVPYPVARVAAAVAAAAARARGREPKLLVTDEVRLARIPMVYSAEKARRELGYRWRSADEALQAAVEWFKGPGFAAPVVHRRTPLLRVPLEG